MRGPESSRWGLACSLALHGILVILGIWGLSFGTRMPVEPPHPIPIDVVTVDQISQAPRPKPKPEKKAVSPPPEEKKIEKPTPDQPEPLIEAAEKNPPQEKEPKVEKKVSDVPLPEKKPIPKKKKIDKPKKTTPPKNNEFLSVLKNLEASKEAEVSDFLEPDLASESNNAAEKISDNLTISETDLIKRQLYQCWNVPAGAKDANDLIVVLDLTMNRDGTVQSASVLEERSSTRHPFYRAGADSALRAVHHPQCVPLKLPLDRYESWKTFTFTFTPKDVR